MSDLPVRSFSSIVATAVAGAQSRAKALVDFSVGSVLLAVIEAVAGVSLWLQGLVLQVLLKTRAATSEADDLDSWMADYGLTRLGATAATGSVTFSRFTPSATAPQIPVGATVRTNDNSTTFLVIADASNPRFNSSLGAYVMPAGIASISVPVASAVPGVGGNVVSGAISRITSALPGIDTVTNAAATSGGCAAEEDGDFRARFIDYLLGLARGDKYGLSYALRSTGLAIQWRLLEDQALDGTPLPGTFSVIADDGTGSPDDDFLATVRTAVESVRPLGIQAAVFGPTVTLATISMILTLADGYDEAAVMSQVQDSVKIGVNGLGLGNPLVYTRIAAWAYGVAGVASVSSILVNGGTADLAATPRTTIKIAPSGVIVGIA